MITLVTYFVGVATGALLAKAVILDDRDRLRAEVGRLRAEPGRAREPAPRPVGRRKVRTDRGDEGRWL